MPPSASAMFPDNPGRFQSSHPCNLQRATHTPPRRNKQKHINNILFKFNGILTVLVRRPCASSKHRLDKGGKPKVDASQMLPRCIPDPRCPEMPPRCLPDPRCLVPPLPLMCRRWTRRDSEANRFFCFFWRLKMTLEITVKCGENRCPF